MKKTAISKCYLEILKTYLWFYEKLELETLQIKVKVSIKENQFELEVLSMLGKKETQRNLQGKPMDIFMQLPLVLKDVFSMKNGKELPYTPSFNYLLTPFFSDVQQRFEQSRRLHYYIHPKIAILIYQMAELLKNELPEQALYCYEYAWVAYSQSAMTNYHLIQIEERLDAHEFTSLLINESGKDYWRNIQKIITESLWEHLQKHQPESLGNIQSAEDLNSIVNSDETFYNLNFHEFRKNYKTQSVVKAAKLNVAFLEENIDQWREVRFILTRIEWLIYHDIDEEKNKVKFAAIFEEIFFKLLKHPHPVIRDYTYWIGGIWLNCHIGSVGPDSLFDKIYDAIIDYSPIIEPNYKTWYWEERLSKSKKELIRFSSYYLKKSV